MFVNDNTINSLKEYFFQKLQEHFSKSEKQILFERGIEHYLRISSLEAKISDKRLSESELLSFRSYTNRLMNGEPYQYILGTTFFFNSELSIRKGALIPRPETEELVAWVLKRNHRENLEFLDIGTGSGAIPIAISVERPSWKVSGIDVSEESIILSKENAKINEVDVNFHLLDILQEKLNHKYDIIVSNPPYVLESDKIEMSEMVLNHEPHLALFVDDKDPLIFYRRIAQLGIEFLKRGGEIYFEIHEDFGLEMTELMTQLDYVDVELKKDLQGKDRMIKAKRK